MRACVCVCVCVCVRERERERERRHAPSSFYTLGNAPRTPAHTHTHTHTHAHARTHHPDPRSIPRCFSNAQRALFVSLTQDMHTHAYTHTHTHTCMHAYTPPSTNLHAQIHSVTIPVSLLSPMGWHIRIHNTHEHTHTQYTRTYTHIHMCMHACMHTHIHPLARTDPSRGAHTQYTRTYTYTIHTHIYTHTHAHACTRTPTHSPAQIHPVVRSPTHKEFLKCIYRSSTIMTRECLLTPIIFFRLQMFIYNLFINFRSYLTSCG